MKKITILLGVFFSIFLLHASNDKTYTQEEITINTIEYIKDVLCDEQYSLRDKALLLDALGYTKKEIAEELKNLKKMQAFKKSYKRL